MARLPIDKRGFPVPYFVAIIDGEPDHRVADERALKACVEQNLCWLCGGKLGRYKAFCIGPMCAITRTISEPPQHLECATYAATACPWMTRPHAKRREVGLPEELKNPAGLGIRRNPGAVCVWVTLKHKPFRSWDGQAGVLFDIGDPESVYWFAEGRQATRGEVERSIDSGLPHLIEQAERDGDAGMRSLNEHVEAVKRLLLVTLPSTLQADMEQGA
jgi:hypothetical protein